MTKEEFNKLDEAQKKYVNLMLEKLSAAEVLELIENLPSPEWPIHPRPIIIDADDPMMKQFEIISKELDQYIENNGGIHE